MSFSHTVQQGEHLSSIAEKYGFRTYQTIWNHSDNAQLKNKRVNPNVLYPGDVLFIPDKTLRTEAIATGAVHVFQVMASNLRLSITIRDRAGKRLPNIACELEVDGQKIQLTTNGDGHVEQAIPRGAQGGTFRVPDLNIESPVKIGHLDPMEEKSGFAGRLRNLGYYRGDLENIDQDQLLSAIEEFQCDSGLTVDGIAGPNTMAKLKDFHGC
jgi:N-acetylmuramoyl-L-alanine amidase